MAQTLRFPTAYSGLDIKKAHDDIQKMSLQELSQYITVGINSLQEDNALSYLEIHDLCRNLAEMKVRYQELLLNTKMDHTC